MLKLLSDNWQTILTTLLALIGFALAALGARGVIWKRRAAKAAYYGFHIVEDLWDEGLQNSYLDKAKAGLDYANRYMLANGWRELKPGEVALTTLEFNRLHGEGRYATAQAAASAVVSAAAWAAAKAKVAAVTSPK